MNLQQLLQKRAELIDKQKALAGGEYTADVKKQFDDLQNEINDLNNQIEMFKAVEQNAKDGVTASLIGGTLDNGMGAEKTARDGGFNSIGEMLYALKYGDKTGRLEVLKAQSTTDGAAGGYLIPEGFSEALLNLSAAESLIRARAFEIPAGEHPDAPINFPALDYSEGVDGGVVVSWIEEGGQKPETSAAFINIKLHPKEVAGFITVNDTLLRNAPAATAIFEKLLVNAITRAEDAAFVNGDGEGKPLGFANSANTGKLVIARVASGTVMTEDIANMMAAYPTDDIANATFIVHPKLKSALVKLKDDAGNYIYIRGDLTKGIPATLLGVPVVETALAGQPGQTGDIQLVNLKKYLIKNGSGIYVSMSEHVKFTTNQTVIKAFRNVDGKPWVPKPYKLEDGVTEVSPYVLLSGTAAQAVEVDNSAETTEGAE